jgi:hypothetical protein
MKTVTMVLFVAGCAEMILCVAAVKGLRRSEIESRESFMEFSLLDDGIRSST